MPNKQFTGILPALVTPVDQDGALLEHTARALIDWQLSQGVQGFYVCGNSGEGPALPDETRRRVTELAVEQTAGRGKIICHVGAADARGALALARHAHAAGCDAISSLPPTAYFDYSEDEIFEYYRALSESAPLPLIVYATAMFRQPDIAPFIGRLMELPNVIGVKFTRQNYYEMRNVIELNGGDINVFNGPDETLVGGLLMGADAGIGTTYNVMPGRFAALYGAFARGDFEAARQAQFGINRVIRVLLRHGLISAVKQTLRELGFDMGEPIWPRRGFTPEEAKALRREMEEAGFRYQ